ISNLASVLGNRANIAMRLEQNEVAVDLYDKMIALLELPSLTSKPLEVEKALATALINRAIALDKTGNLNRALLDYNRAIVLRIKIAEADPTPETRNSLAGACFTQGATLTRANRHAEALILYEKSQRIREILVFQEDHKDFINELALTYQNKAISMKNLGDFQGALATLDKSIHLRERFTQISSDDSFQVGLAIAYFNRGNMHQKIQKPEQARRDYARSVAIFELLIFTQGKYEILHYLARVNRKQAQLYIEMGLHEEAVLVLDNAIKIFRGLVEEKGQTRFKGSLDILLKMKADRIPGYQIS
ncbi:tetratricopeptide repeat protein, partial [bacterium]|nr:tetratricopeptide repeat protein [bacterium]